MRSAGLRGRATAVGIALAALSLTVTSLASCTGQPGQTSQPSQPAQASHTAEAAPGIGKIRHVVIIMQENRSFDSFFGTYPGGGSRLDPATDGRPDPRPDVRENASILGNLAADFDFGRPPRPAVLLPVHPKPGPASTPG